MVRLDVYALVSAVIRCVGKQISSFYVYVLYVFQMELSQSPS